MISVRKYRRVLVTFFRNSLLREMMFRSNFLITLITRSFWFAVQIVMFGLIYRSVARINDWTREEYFGFMATGMLVNAIVEAFFMPNCARFSELIRTGDLDFALLKPIDTQFLVSLEKMELPMISQIVFMRLRPADLLGRGCPCAGHADGDRNLCIVGRGGGDVFLQSDDRPCRDKCLFRTEPGASGFLVLRHDFRAVSEQHLQRLADSRSLPLPFFLRATDPAGRHRSGTRRSR